MNIREIYGENCVYYNNYNKWVPEEVATRFENIYARDNDTPDFVDMCEACTRNNFDVGIPFETFICGYFWQGGRNKETAKSLYDIRMDLVNAVAENKVLNQKLEEAQKQLQQLATEYATFRSNVTESVWQRTINEKDERITKLESILHGAEDEVNLFLKTKQAEHDEEMRKKAKEITDLQSKHLDQEIKDKQEHFEQLSQKDKQINKLRSDLAEINRKLEKAKQEAELSLLNPKDKTLNKELQLADNLAKFKRVTWSLLEKVLVSYDNTMLYIDEVECAVKDCQMIVDALIRDTGNIIKSRFNRVSAPNVKESKASVKEFEDKYLDDVREEAEQMKRLYDLDSFPSKRLDSFDTITMDQSE